MGVAFALTFVAAVMMANDLAPSHLRATGQALMKSVLFGLAPIAGSVGGGLIYGELGPRIMFLIATGIVGAAGLIVLIAVPARHRVGQEPLELHATSDRVGDGQLRPAARLDDYHQTVESSPAMSSTGLV